MDNNTNTNRNNLLIEIEDQAFHLRTFLEQNSSRGLNLYHINRFLTTLFSCSNPLLVEANFTEFFPVYLRLLESFDPTGQKINTSQSILKNAIMLYKNPGDVFRRKALGSCIKLLKQQIKIIKSALEGTISPDLNKALTVFPVVESIADAAKFTYLDSIDVKVAPSKGGNRFIVHPTFKEEDKTLIEQVKTSLDAALNMIPKEREKLPKAFEVQVFFNSKLGIYSGDSFGGLLAILIFFEINKLLKLNILHQIVPSLAFTGAIDASGTIKSVGKNNIVMKVRSVFFSGITRFVLPKDDETLASSLITKLQEKWPQRKLEIIGVNNISEIFNRRDIINISRRPIKDKIKDGVKKYKYALLILLPMIILLWILSAREFDTNPVSFELDKTNLKILNKYGAVLWNVVVDKGIEPEMNLDDLKIRIRVIDLDGDGVNEVLCTGDFFEMWKATRYSSLICLNGNKEELWRFVFRDTVSSPKESNIPGEYGVHISDTITINGKKRLLVRANNGPTYPSALFYIDPVSGQKVSESVWHAGFIEQVGFADINGDGVRDLVFSASDNAFRLGKIIAVDINISESMIGTREDYMLYGKKLANPLLEIAIPKTDYTEKIAKLHKDIFPGRSIYTDEQGRLSFRTRFSFNKTDAMYLMTLDPKTHEIDYFIEGGYKSVRDSLVNAGKLPLPYTDTKEYTDNLKNGVRYRKDGKWVTYKEYLRK